MSLRLRLTLLYTTLLGLVLMLAGALIYSLVSVNLINQVDSSLVQSSNQIIDLLRVNMDNRFDPRSIASYQPTENLVIQLWNYNNELEIARPALWQQTLDADGLQAGKTVIHSTQTATAHMRVISIPLRSVRGPAGVLQLGLSLGLVDTTQQTLAVVVLIMTLVAMFLTGLATWLLTGRALAPLQTVTTVATQITRADDLSRRIPLTSNPEDEVGSLILAFNQTMERLEQLFTSQRRFVADVSHELRTPLTVIKGNISLMRKMCNQEDAEILADIDSEVDRLTRMVTDLLLLAQVDAGSLPLDRKPVDLDTLLLEVFEQMRVLAGDRVKITIVDIDQVIVPGDRDRLKQVILNLVGNAVQYTPPGGEVHLTLQKDGQRGILSVSDNGPGIPAKDLPHIFERFYRGDQSRKRNKSSGFGLGLSIAYWIAVNHDGALTVNSTEGAGTTFTLSLPLQGNPPSLA